MQEITLTTDRRTQLIFRPFWAVVRPFAHFIYSEGFAAAVRHAERRT